MSYTSIAARYFLTHLTKDESKGVGKRPGGIEEKVKLDASNDNEKCGNHFTKPLLGCSSE